MSRAGVIRLAVFGQPVRHSLSPRIHGLFAEQAGLDVDYRAIEAAPGTLGMALETFAAEGGVGCNVTLPLKAEAMALADTGTDRVERAAAANTLVRDGDGWWADNTDGLGLVADLRRLGLDPGGRHVAILGAGGAAAGVLATLLSAGPREVRLFNRTPKKARALADRHTDLGPVSADGFDALGKASFDLVLNATSLGHDGDLPPVTREVFGPDGVLYDLNYGPAAEPLADWARQARLPFHDGLGMLVGQAAESFERWTGFRPDTGPVLAALRT